VVEVKPLIRVLLGVLIVAFAIVLGIVIIYRAFHAVHTADAGRLVDTTTAGIEAA
jgi:hypothetical protein